jgi:hypothetical protein
MNAAKTVRQHYHCNVKTQIDSLRSTRDQLLVAEELATIEGMWGERNTTANAIKSVEIAIANLCACLPKDAQLGIYHVANWDRALDGERVAR